MILKLIQIVLSTSLYLLIAKAQSNTTSTTDLLMEYYTTIPTITKEFISQDEKDAQEILDSDKKEEVMASILSYRDKIRRFAISEQISNKIKGGIKKIIYWITYWYNPEYRTSFENLCYGLVRDENQVLGGFLHSFFDRKNETLIIIGMVLVKDMQNMISTYDNHHFRGNRIKNLRKKQRHPFENMLRVWVECNRHSIEEDDPNYDSIKKDADDLDKEQKDGGWHENRDQIEQILMKKSIKYARLVIQEFEKTNDGHKIEDIIIGNIESCKLDDSLARTYASLARYIKDKHSYTADLLYQYSDGYDKWNVWIMVIAVIYPEEWSKIEEVFKKNYKEDSLSKFILKKLTADKVMAEMIALIVDPTFKPTTFTEKPPTPSQPTPTPPVTP